MNLTKCREVVNSQPSHMTLTFFTGYSAPFQMSLPVLCPSDWMTLKFFMVSPKKSCLPLTLEGRMTHPDTLLAWGQEWEAPAECDFLWLGQLSLPVCGMAPNTCSYCCSHCINPQSVFMDRKLQPSSGMKLVALSKVHRKGPTHSSAPLTWFAFYTHTSQIRGLAAKRVGGTRHRKSSLIEGLFSKIPILNGQ